MLLQVQLEFWHNAFVATSDVMILFWLLLDD